MRVTRCSSSFGVALFLLLTAAIEPVAAQNRGTVRGTVRSEDNSPIAGAQVSIPALRIGAVTNADPVADDRRKTVISVDDRSILDIRFYADLDSFGVAPDHHERPDGRAGLQRDIPAHECEWMDERHDGFQIGCRQRLPRVKREHGMRGRHGKTRILLWRKAGRTQAGLFF